MKWGYMDNKKCYPHTPIFYDDDGLKLFMYKTIPMVKKELEIIFQAKDAGFSTFATFLFFFGHFIIVFSRYGIHVNI